MRACHPSPQPERHVDLFGRFGRVHGRDQQTYRNAITVTQITPYLQKYTESTHCALSLIDPRDRIVL